MELSYGRQMDVNHGRRWPVELSRGNEDLPWLRWRGGAISDVNLVSIYFSE